MTSRRLLSLLVLLGVSPFVVGETTAAERVHVVIGPDAPPLERFAAQELSGQFGRLFDDVEAVTETAVPTNTEPVVLIGSPQTNPAVKTALGSGWPRVTDQGIVLRSFSDGNRQGLVVGGGSPAATLWAVYELGHRFGIRYLLREDIFPLEKAPLKLDGFNVSLEPQLRTRSWRTVNDFAIGPESWGLAQHKPFLRQLAKLKFNHLLLAVYPWQPFVHYEFGGVKKQTATLWFGERFRVDGDTVGKKAFGGAKFFENPDFAGKSSYEEMTAAGTKHLRGIIDEAHRLGMTVGLSISTLEFPREFQPALPGSRVATGLKNLTILPTAAQGPNDKTLKKLVATKIRAYLQTYPSIDALYLSLPEFPEWDQHATAAWEQLSSRRNLGELSLDKLIASASSRNLIASGDRGRRAIKGNVVMLAFLNNLLEDKSLLRTPEGRQVQLVLRQVDPALFPVLDRVVPPGAATLNFVDYTARRVAENRELLSLLPAKKVRSGLIMTLADDNVGLLSQSALQRIGTLIDELKRLGWDGFSTRYWVPGELDPVVYYLSRASWDPKVTPRSAHDDFWMGITDNKAVTERLWLGWQHLEQATELIDRHNLGFAFPVEGMLMKHYKPQPAPEWWKEVNEHYTQLMIELYRSQGAVDPRARRLLFYYAKRGEYVLYYLAAVTAVREAAIAKQAGETEQAIEHLEQAVESMYDCITTLADVATDQSDRGLIAVLNKHAYRPLLAEFERMLDDQN